MRCNIEDDLVAYLESRAKRNRRSPTNELNAIPTEVRNADREAQQEEQGLQQELQQGPQRGPQLIIPVVRPPPINLPAGYLGVRQATNGWAAEIQIDDQRHGLGIYSTPEEAAYAYDTYVRQLPGRHQTNFPEPENNPQSNNQLDQQLDRLENSYQPSYQPADEIGFPCPVCASYERCDCMPNGPGFFPTPGLKALPGIRVTPSNKPPRNFTEDGPARFRKKVEPVNEPDGEGSVDD